MGDWFQSVVDRDATDEDAPILAKVIHEWLVGEGIVCAESSDCVLSRSGTGFAPGPNYLTAVDGIDEYLQRLRTNGLAIITTRTVFDSGQGGFELVCSACLARSIPSDEWGKAIGEWHQRKGPGWLSCPHCGFSRPITEWQHEPTWAFASLGFQFWNWPPLRRTFVDEFQTRLKHRVVLVVGKL